MRQLIPSGTDFSFRWNCPHVMSYRKEDGRLFHISGPATSKYRIQSWGRPPLNPPTGGACRHGGKRAPYGSERPYG